MKVHSGVVLAMTGETAIGCQPLSILWQSKFKITWHVFSFALSYCLNFAYRLFSWTFISILLSCHCSQWASQAFVTLFHRLCRPHVRRVMPNMRRRLIQSKFLKPLQKRVSDEMN
jgi:hypothetical protein